MTHEIPSNVVPMIGSVNITTMYSKPARMARVLFETSKFSQEGREILDKTEEVIKDAIADGIIENAHLCPQTIRIKKYNEHTGAGYQMVVLTLDINNIDSKEEAVAIVKSINDMTANKF